MNHFRNIIIALVALVGLQLTSCSSDNETPVIESVWTNSSAAPAEKVDFSYPGATVCLHGRGFSDLEEVSVNGVAIELMKTIMYDTDSFITFTIPEEVQPTAEGGLSEIKVKTANGVSTYQSFLIKPTAEQPKVTGVSTQTLTAGGILEIKGENLEGASEVYLPLTFDQSVKCELAADQEQTATSVFVVIPENVTFAKGMVKVVLNKHSEELDRDYTESVYSTTKINFTNK